MIAAALVLAATVAATSTAPAPEPPRVLTKKVPGSQIPTEIAQHAGALWFVAWKNWPKLEPHIGRITLKGTIQMSEIMNGSLPGLTARSADGSLWLTDGKRPGLWRVLSGGQIKRVKIDQPTLSVAFGPDGMLWCTHPSSATVSSYGLDGSLKGRWNVAQRNGVEARPEWLTTGPDGALWFTDRATDTIGRVATTGAVQVFPLPKGWSDPGEIVASEDQLWFTIANQPLLGRITPKGNVTSVKIHARARAVAPGADGRMWYSDGASGIGWVESDGTSDYLLISEKPAAVRSLAAGPDGAMWFVDEKSCTVGRVEPPAKP